MGCKEDIADFHAHTKDTMRNLWHQSCWEESADGKIARGLAAGGADDPQLEMVREFVDALLPGTERCATSHAVDKDAIEVQLLSARGCTIMSVGCLSLATDGPWKEDLQQQAEEIFGASSV